MIPFKLPTGSRGRLLLAVAVIASISLGLFLDEPEAELRAEPVIQSGTVSRGTAPVAPPAPVPPVALAAETAERPSRMPSPMPSAAAGASHDQAADDVTAPERSWSHITLIIDDIGNNEALGERALALPGAVTYAVLPHTPHAVKLATQAHEAGKEVMLHAPMSNLAHRPLGEGALTPQLTEAEFIQTLERSLAAVPFVQGVNNHMGSELTGARMQMQWLMRELKQRDLFFVDSVTSARSIAAQTASDFQVPNLRRQVFLDNEASHENVDREFRRLLAIAQQQGSAVGIGHPYEATLTYLEKALPQLEAQGIRLISASDMLQLHAHEEGR